MLRLVSDVRVFLATKIDLDCTIIFTVDQNFYEKYLSTPQLLQQNFGNPEVMKETQNTVRLWGKQVERVSNLNLTRLCYCFCKFALKGFSPV